MSYGTYVEVFITLVGYFATLLVSFISFYRVMFFSPIWGLHTQNLLCYGTNTLLFAEPSLARLNPSRKHTNTARGGVGPPGLANIAKKMFLRKHPQKKTCLTHACFLMFLVAARKHIRVYYSFWHFFENTCVFSAFLGNTYHNSSLWVLSWKHIFNTCVFTRLLCLIRWKHMRISRLGPYSNI